MAHTEADFWRGALTTIANGDKLAPLFACNGIKCIRTLLGWAPSFGAGALEGSEVIHLHEGLGKANTEGGVAQPVWTTDIDKAGKYLRSIILHARDLAPIEASQAFERKQHRHLQEGRAAGDDFEVRFLRREFQGGNHHHGRNREVGEKRQCRG
jgi:hypothetical protein